MTPGSAPGCSDFQVSRRRFLAGAAAVLGGAVVSSMVGDVFTQAAFGAATTPTNTLVVLSLRGGCDGLSLVVPHGDSAYRRARPTLAVPTRSLLAKDDLFGLHPQLKPLLPMWKAGTFGAVHAVGLPSPNRSHFSAMEAVEDADAGSVERVGWLNRMVGMTGGGDDPREAVQLGGASTPTSLAGPAQAFATNTLAELKLPGGDTAAEQRQIRAVLRSLWSGEETATGRAARDAVAVSASLAKLTRPAKPANQAKYPAGDLGRALAGAARLIRAKVGVQVVTLDYGGWDMHTDLGTVDRGAMRTQTRELAKGVAAFFTDLGAAADRVTLVTMSEFGRRVEENGSGTDHGYGNAMLAFGAGVRGGRVHTRWPGLASGRLIDGDLAVTTDYRTVLSEVIRSRFPTATLATVFPGFVAGRPIGLMA